jgi:phospholipid/cholesterol/gamma-HCH transport system substrate-binding protein
VSQSTPLPKLLRWARATHVLAVVIAVAVVAGIGYAVWPDPPQTHVTAHFPRTIGLYEGSDVRVLGVKIGSVDKVVPEGETVRVELSYDRKHKVPANAKAVIAAPSLVSDRYVQLTPVYRSGPVLGDGADIPLRDTAVPVELDRIYSSLNELSVALGPEGANKDGSLSKLLDTSAKNLDGQGKKVHATVGDLADAVGTLSDNREDLFATVRQLQDFTTTLANNDDNVRTFNSDLQVVADQLSGERADLQKALDNLAVALSEVSSFVHDNRDGLRQNIDGLTELSKTLVKQQKALREVLDESPVALANLDRTYNSKSGTLDTRNNFAQTDDPGLYLCSLLQQLGQPQDACKDLRALLDDLPLPPLPGGEARATTTNVGRDLTLGGILAPTPRNRSVAGMDTPQDQATISRGPRKSAKEAP